MPPLPDTPSASLVTSTQATPTPAATAPTTCAARTLASMTEAQRIGQLFMLGLTRDRLDATERRAIAEFHFDPQRVEKQGRRGPCVTTLPSRSSEKMEVGDPGP